MLERRNTDCKVIIPTHKEDMSPEEEQSFRNTVNVLNNWDIEVILPFDVNGKLYEDLAAQEGWNVTVRNLPEGWMGSIAKYNDMGLDPDFYRLYSDHRYVLICHLDAWVFRDELQYWIDKDYDYIGAPWFLPKADDNVSILQQMCPGGGNGGFCLRKVDKMIEVCEKLKRTFNISVILKAYFWLRKNKRLDLFKIFLKGCRGMIREGDEYRKKYNIYEDAVISVFGALLGKNLKVAPPHEAMFFATEVHSDELLQTAMKFKLPFGMHGYDKYFASPEQFDSYRGNANRNLYTARCHGQKADKKHNAKPLITVVTATYNLIEAGRVETFRECVESVHSQSYDNIEYIIIDGGSTDGSLEIIQEYVDKGWCKLDSRKDNGIWDAMYRGHKAATGDFVNYLNSDDYFCSKDAVKIAVNALKKADADWFYSGGTILQENGSSFTFPTSLYGVFSCMGILHQTMFVRRELLDAINAFHYPCITRENYLMMCLITNDFKVAFSPKELVHYREGGFSFDEYGNDQIRTASDFGTYFFNHVGQYWGMSIEECCNMFGWMCIGQQGFLNNWRLSRKLRDKKLKWDFRKKLFAHTREHKSIALLAKKAVKLFWKKYVFKGAAQDN